MSVSFYVFHTVSSGGSRSIQHLKKTENTKLRNFPMSLLSYHQSVKKATS